MHYIKTVPCELQGGHIWNEPITAKDILENTIKLIICINCGKVKSGEDEKS